MSDSTHPSILSKERLIAVL